MWERPKVSPVLAQHSTYTAKGGMYKFSHWQMWHGTHYHPQRFVVHLLRPPRSPVLHFCRALHIAPYGTPEKAIIQALCLCWRLIPFEFLRRCWYGSRVVFKGHQPVDLDWGLGGGGQISDEISPDLLMVSSDHTSEPSPSKKEISAAVKRWQSLTALV